MKRARLHPDPRPTSAAPSSTTAGGRLNERPIETQQASPRRLRLESIRILPPQYVTLTDEQEVRAVAVLSELLMPLLRGRLLPPANSCEASTSGRQEAL